ncbi:MAG: hypothetical protein K5686_00845 [Lachnospiraceae bacterium]|nr:hypothetical protein [Lachnospiraceae bacterium]
MDRRVRNLTLIAVISIFILTFALILYLNRDKAAKPAVVPAAEPGEETAESTGYRDFLKDDSFFDNEEYRPVVVKEEQRLPRLYLTATSIAHDMRLSVTDEDGRVVSGISFYVDIEPEGEYKDLDKDGLIYVPELKAGDYYVTLRETEGYEVPKDPMRVTVKEQLEYTVIEDIALYVKSEDEIDAEVEDTEVREAADDADETEHTDKWEGTDAAFGVDVSKYQKEIDWKKAAAAGVQFAIVRCGYRGSSSGALVEDPYFKKNMEGAAAAGVQLGVYFFTQAVNETEAVEEASMAAMLCKDYELDYPIFIDVESAGGRADNLDTDTRTAVIKAFCETVQSAGYHGGIYASRSWFEKKIHDEEIEDYVRWLAEWRATPKYKGNFSLWQYTSSGHIDGINNRVDLDLVWNGGKGENNGAD